MKINEQGRLDAVKRFLKLNDNISRDLTDIVNLTAEIFGAPIAVVTLVDEQIQWIKAKKGLDTLSTKRDESICQFTIKEEDVLVIEDTLLDERTKELPSVINGRKLRFYAGANLTTHEGYNVGSLCVLDTKPRQFSAAQLNNLKILARQVINIMELSRSIEVLNNKHIEILKQKQETDRSQLQLQAIFDSSKDIFILLGKHMEILSANKAAVEHVNKVSGMELKDGAFFSDYMESVVLKKFIRFYSAALAGHNVRTEFHVRRDTPNAAWMETSFMTVKSGGKILGVAINATDISARKKHELHIDMQNKALNKIAIIQSHDLRKPVASLMGILGLINIEMKNPKKEYPYFGLIEETINELNQKICGIVEESENTLNTRVYDD